jgi:hypothetical protein
MFSAANSFKQTEIGLTPEDWGVVRLGEVAKYKKGKKPEKLFEVCKTSYHPYLTAEYFREGVAKQFAAVETKANIVRVSTQDIVLI